MPSAMTSSPVRASLALLSSLWGRLRPLSDRLTILRISVRSMCARLFTPLVHGIFCCLTSLSVFLFAQDGTVSVFVVLIEIGRMFIGRELSLSCGTILLASLLFLFCLSRLQLLFFSIFCIGVKQLLLPKLPGLISRVRGRRSL